MFCIFKRKAEAAAILQSHLAARRGRTYFSVNCLLHILINYTENVTDLYAHTQTVDTRHSSPIFQAPGYKANLAPSDLRSEFRISEVKITYLKVEGRLGGGLGLPCAYIHW